MTEQTLAQEIALVTGASRGIGRAIAIELARAAQLSSARRPAKPARRHHAVARRGRQRAAASC